MPTKLIRRQAVEIPPEIIRNYLKWLRNPRGVEFGASMITRRGQLIDVTLPFVKVKRA